MFDAETEMLCSQMSAAPENLARGKPSWQSSVERERYFAGFAVDGNKDTNIFHGSCSSTEDSKDSNPFWSVDLGQLINVGFVQVTNRGDCCGEFSNGFIYILSTSYLNFCLEK